MTDPFGKGRTVGLPETGGFHIQNPIGGRQIPNLQEFPGGAGEGWFEDHDPSIRREERTKGFHELESTLDSVRLVLPQFVQEISQGNEMEGTWGKPLS
jgi:hypothetical protein